MLAGTCELVHMDCRIPLNIRQRCQDVNPFGGGAGSRHVYDYQYFQIITAIVLFFLLFSFIGQVAAGTMFRKLLNQIHVTATQEPRYVSVCNLKMWHCFNFVKIYYKNTDHGLDFLFS